MARNTVLHKCQQPQDTNMMETDYGRDKKVEEKTQGLVKKIILLH